MTQSISVHMDTSNYKAMSGVKVTKMSIQPENLQTISVTQNSTTDVYFQINNKPNSFLNGMNSYMSYTYTYTGTTATAGASLENCNGSSNFIQTLEVTAGSTSLEMISNYNVLSATLDDFQSGDRCKSLCSILQDKSITENKRGLTRIVAPGGVGFTEERRVCVPLLSSTIGCLAEKYLPVGGKDMGLRVRMTMADPVIALKLSGVADAPVGYTLRDVTLELEYLEVAPSIYQSLAAESEGIFKVSGVGIANFSNTGISGVTMQNFLIPARYSSVRNFLTVNRLQTVLTNKLANSTGNRTRDNINSYLYRIGGISYPSMSVSVDAFTGAECLTEVIKTFHGHADLNMNVCFNRDEFVRNAVAPTGAIAESAGTFVMGVDFEEAGFTASQMSGISTIGGNTFLELTYANPSVATQFDTFCFYDQIIEINSATGEVSISR